MQVRRRLAPKKLTRYQEFVSVIRRYDRDMLLVGLSALSRGWDGSTHDENGALREFLPWSILGASAVAICRGTPGGKTPTVDSFREICYLYSNLEHPDTGSEESFVQSLSRLVYQQAEFQKPAEISWARTVAIYGETTFEAEFVPSVLKEGWDQDLFGCSLSSFLTAGFALYAGTNAGGAYPLLWADETREILDYLGGEEGLHAIVEANFIADIDEIKKMRRSVIDSRGLSKADAYRREPFAFNPLIARPLVGGVQPGRYIAPAIPAIHQRCSAAGVVFAGLDKWGEAFTQEAGLLFESYIGRNLRLLSGVEVIPEIIYKVGKDKRKSVDWIVVFPDAVLLIECKNAMPTAVIREGHEGVGSEHVRKLGKAVEQVNTTARLILEEKHEFRTIPSDRKLIGLVVTLETFELANDPPLRNVLPVSTIPTGIVGPDAIEHLVTVSESAAEQLFSIADAHTTPENTLHTRAWLGEVEGHPNGILVSAFDKIPIVAHAKSLGIRTS